MFSTLDVRVSVRPSYVRMSIRPSVREHFISVRQLEYLSTDFLQTWHINWSWEYLRSDC